MATVTSSDFGALLQMELGIHKQHRQPFAVLPGLMVAPRGFTDRLVLTDRSAGVWGAL